MRARQVLVICQTFSVDSRSLPRSGRDREWTEGSTNHACKQAPVHDLIWEVVVRVPETWCRFTTKRKPFLLNSLQYSCAETCSSPASQHVRWPVPQSSNCVVYNGLQLWTRNQQTHDGRLAVFLADKCETRSFVDRPVEFNNWFCCFSL